MRLPFLIAILTSLTFCSKAPDSVESFAAEQVLSPDDRHQLMMPIVRHIGDGLELELIHVDSTTGFTYFMVTRAAKSLYEKRIAIGGKLKTDSADSLIHFEEIFRTWKMTEDQLKPKSALLFRLMIEGKDLSPWYPENSGAEEYIEFPNSTITYDPQLRKWTTTAN